MAQMSSLFSGWKEGPMLTYSISFCGSWFQTGEKMLSGPLVYINRTHQLYINDKYNCASVIFLLYLVNNTQPFAVGYPHGLELIVNECKLGAVFGKCWKHSRHPKQSYIRMRRVELVELSLDIISTLSQVNNRSRLSS